MHDTVNLPLAGTFYEAAVPNTLDLAERASLAINGLGGNIDPALLTMYGLIHFCARRPHLSHWASAETLCDPKFAESFPLMRLMSGSNQYADLERQFRDAILSRVDDGLYWDRAESRRPWRNAYAPEFYVVHLFLNRAGRSVDVESCLPYEGRVVIRNKTARRVAIRVPSWVDARALRCKTDQAPCEPHRIGRYLHFENLPAGAVLTLLFPVATQTATYTVNAHTPQERQYACTFRGSTLIDVAPRDQTATSYPLYQRSYMLSATTPFHRVQRFVAARTVFGW